MNEPTHCLDCHRPSLPGLARCAGHTLHNRLSIRAKRANRAAKKILTDDELGVLTIEERHSKYLMAQIEKDSAAG